MNKPVNGLTYRLLSLRKVPGEIAEGELCCAAGDVAEPEALCAPTHCDIADPFKGMLI